jgi:hypothetical protein
VKKISSAFERVSSKPATEARARVGPRWDFWSWVFPFDLILIVYWVMAWLAMQSIDKPLRPLRALTLLSSAWFTGALFLWIALFLVVKVLWQKWMTGRFLHELILEALRPYLSWNFLYRAFRVTTDLAILMTIYVTLKQNIPLFNGSIYDPGLIAIERIVHFGIFPYHALAPLYSIYYLSRATDWLYVLWYSLKVPVLALFLMQPVSRFVRFYSAYFLLWILGGTMAIILASFGPVFIDFHPVQEQAAPIARALQVHLAFHYDALTRAPQTYYAPTYEGIAAFPSLHVGVVALWTLFLFTVRRLLGLLMAVYTLIVLFGSVYLGWHYAIDSYAGILLAVMIFIVSGWLADLVYGKPSSDRREPD